MSAFITMGPAFKPTFLAGESVNDRIRRTTHNQADYNPYQHAKTLACWPRE